MSKTNKVDGLFVIPFGHLILKTVSPLAPHSRMARWNPAGGLRGKNRKNT